jgi:Domain of unknown function (DUF5916)
MVAPAPTQPPVRRAPAALGGTYLEPTQGGKIRRLLAPWLAAGAACSGLLAVAQAAAPLRFPQGAGTSDSAPQPQRPRYQVAHLPQDVSGPLIDGLPDDACWDLAPLLDGFVQVEPRPGAACSQRTELRLLRGLEALYVAYYAYDSEPDLVRGSQRARDADLDPDDRIEILLSTLGDGRNAFWFQIGPAGGQGDALIGLSGQSFNKAWDGLWLARSQRTAEGWFAEFEIPWATLDFDPSLDQWGFNARRFVRRAEEESRWSGTDPSRRFFSPAECGVLLGMQGLQRGLGLDLKPFVTGTFRDEGENLDVDRLGTGGLDLYWRPGPNTKLSLSANTDFAEAEIDDRQINLTRFSLFFPERRDFFVEDSSAYLFGLPNNDVVAFFSRSIGLDAERRQVPILGAGKFVYRDERWSVGLLNAQIDATDEVSSQNLAVARLQGRFLEQSDFGVIATNGDPDFDRSAQTVGSDFNLRTNRLLGDLNGRATFYWLSAEADAEELAGAATQGQAFGAELDLPNDRWTQRLTFLRSDEDFDPRLGFVARPGVEQWRGQFQFRPRFDGAVRRLVFAAEPTYITDLEGQLESAGFDLTPLRIDWFRGDSLSLRFEHNREVLTDPLEFPDELFVDPGDYRFNRQGIEFESSERRPLALNLAYFDGQFYDGTRRNYASGLTWFQSAAFNLGLDYEYTELRLSNGDRDLHVADLRGVVSFHQDLSIRTQLQFDNVSSDLGLISQLRWIRKPGDELFLVVSQSYLATSEDINPTSSAAILKLVWTLRF